MSTFRLPPINPPLPDLPRRHGLGEPFTLASLALPEMPLRESHRLPTGGAIYFVLSGCGALLYIGRAGQLRKRWRLHAMRALEQVPGVKIAWLACDDFTYQTQFEQACIRYFRPVLNTTYAGERGQQPEAVADRALLLPCSVVRAHFFPDGTGGATCGCEHLRSL